MDAMILTLIFVAAVSVAGCVSLVFSAPIEQALQRLLPIDMTRGGSLFAKFAVFTASFIGGLRLTEIGALIVPKAASGAPAPSAAGEALLEVYKTLAGALGGAAWTLLAFFGAALALHAAARLSDSVRTMNLRPRHDDRMPDRHGRPADSRINS